MRPNTSRVHSLGRPLISGNSNSGGRFGRQHAELIELERLINVYPTEAKELVAKLGSNP
jgi:hypothetical protein